MKVTCLKDPIKFIELLQTNLRPYEVEMYDLKFTSTKSVGFRLRSLNEKEPIEGMIMQDLTRLDDTELELVCNVINHICDINELGGSLQTTLNGRKMWIRSNGKTMIPMILSAVDFEVIKYSNDNVVSLTLAK